MPHQINTLNEKPLHAALKDWYVQPGDEVEVKMKGFYVDIVRGGLLIEIQTRGFAAIRRKLGRLVDDHPIRLVYPIAAEKWIVRLDKDGKVLGRRKSPKHGAHEDVFEELVSMPRLMQHPNMSLETLLIQEEEVRYHDPNRGWRRKGWMTHERRLLKVLDRRIFTTAAELAAFIPEITPELFTTADLAIATKRPRWVMQKMAYCLREMDAIHVVGKKRNAIVYERTLLT